ncbi:hypothetical protein H6G51_06210 [Limnothrix sp. FACHB-708]|uniref:hypothetical protein n=1 Tax=unclassified Limnothrix TaxID=2632864 RepID=UPI000C161AD1|nr:MULTISPECIES: hypothetical protein [unclassified Limnothrix]MBD2162606.1 hypothetical protein [Limnothrix sp. FACHB-1083]MBD2193712.1 hypothetical protein [Limnothrix sp. FACHB-1088]MBD2552864.1 hypothetical protein [Limnothrix sp. FACHB-708]MBD2589324.1 hypothetical protein [Limnothrix sp. FACHB-406]PIB08172.1 hypothetical protein AMR42_13975 [Limnothrix sp. PR1529]
MANSLVQKMLEDKPGLIFADGEWIGVKVADLLGPVTVPTSAEAIGDDLLMGLLYRLMEVVSKAEDAWVPPAGTKKVNSLSVVESTSLQQIAPGVRGVINQATIRVVQPVEMQQVEAVRS